MLYLTKSRLLKAKKLKSILQIYVFMPHDLNYSGDGNTNLLRDLLKRMYLFQEISLISNITLVKSRCAI